MKTFWQITQTGPVLNQRTEFTQKDGKEYITLGGVELDHGFAFPWVYLENGEQLHLPAYFDSQVEKAKSSVENHLTRVGIIKNLQLTPPSLHEKVA